MIRTFSARRRAEEFAAAVDDGRPSRNDEAAELLGLVAALRDVEPVSPRPEFAADLRGRLMAEASTAIKPGTANLLLPTREHSRRERRLIAAASAFVLVGGTTTMAAAAQGSLPGEALYPIKRGLEQAESTLSTGPAGKGRDLLSQASSRLDEVQGLLTADPLRAEPRIPGTLVDYTTSAREGASLLFESFHETGDPATMVTVRMFAADGIATLEDLSDDVPAEARGELADAAVMLSELDREATALCSGCAEDLPAVEVPGAFLAYAEVDRALAQAAGHDLANDHPVVVPKETLDRLREVRHDVAGSGPDAPARPGPSDAPLDAPDADRQVNEPAPTLPGPGTWPSLLPDGDKSTGGEKLAKDGKDAVSGLTKDLGDGLGGVVETLLPDPDGGSLLD